MRGISITIISNASRIAERLIIAMVFPEKSTLQKFRLVTRSDLNGLACLGLLKTLGIVDKVEFTFDRDIESGRFPVSNRDITAGLPYNDKVHLAFNYYTPRIIHRKQIVDYSAASTARVIYNHYNGPKKFPGFPVDILRAVDKATLAQYSIEDVLHPEGWDLLSFILDHRTGLDRYTDFEVSNEELIRRIADEIGSVSIKDIFEWPIVKERVAIYREQEGLFMEQIKSNSEINNNLVTVDLRNEPIVYAGNRFIVYALFPHISVSMTIVKGRRNHTREISLGKSIFSGTSSIHLGKLMEKYGGGGHASAAGCVLDEKRIDDAKSELEAKITYNKSVKLVKAIPQKPTSQKFRLLTHSDLNGLACLALLKTVGIVDRVEFPYDRHIESGRFPVSNRDITAGLPYKDKVHLAFNYYTPRIIHRKQIVDYSAASTAMVIYNHYGGPKKFPEFPIEILQAVDRAILARYSIEEVLHPEGWDLLSFMLDHRTGMDRYTEFSVSSEDLIRRIADEIGSVSIKDIFEWTMVKERVAIYREQEELFREQIKNNSTINNNLVTVDLRNEPMVYAGNRFIVYALFPHISVSMTIVKGNRPHTREISLGKSIFSRTSTVHLGKLMEKHGGGGHASAAGCVLDEKIIDEVRKELEAELTFNNPVIW